MKRIIERFKNSILAPKKIAPYAFDKFGKVLLYLLFWVVLISVPFIINIFTTPLIDHSEYSLIKDALVGSDVIDAQIIDNQLISAQEAPYIVNVKDLGVTLIFDPTFNANELKGETDLQSVILLLGKEELFLLFQPARGFITPIPLADYSKLENINNIDFARAVDRNDAVFWEQLYASINDLVDIFILRVRLSQVGITIFDSLLVLAASILLITVLIKLFKGSFPITFKEIFKVVTYSYTPYALGLLLGVLYNLSWLDDIAMIVSVVFANVATSELVRIKLTNRQMGEK